MQTIGHTFIPLPSDCILNHPLSLWFCNYPETKYCTVQNHKQRFYFCEALYVFFSQTVLSLVRYYTFFFPTKGVLYSNHKQSPTMLKFLFSSEVYILMMSLHFASVIWSRFFCRVNGRKICTTNIIFSKLPFIFILKSDVSV